MLRSLGEPARSFGRALRHRARKALCVAEATSDAHPGSRSLDGQRGSAVVEFTFLATLLLVPLIYFVVTIGQIQGASFGVVGAADQAAKVFVTQSDPAGAKLAAEQSVVVALADYGHTPEQATVQITCDQENCLASGASVTVTVGLDVPLPMVPFGDTLHLSASRLTASATQIVGRFQ
ncbi:hypothetical protein ACFUOZ_04615 [Paenarthrobacter sp. NPDC057355]|uniref:hypothetical protein n=1 Tax=Paenarthrobacter sp. NPDC057355 TaxID=3346105 RepID=UPI00363AAA88